MISNIQPLSSQDTSAITEVGSVRPVTPQRSQPAPPQPQQTTDTVQLSVTSQALSMRQNGASVSQIASSLGLSEAQVDSELGLTTTTSSSSSQAAILAAFSAKH